MRLKTTRQLALAMLAALTFAGPAAASSFSNLYIFGDSLSDTGNAWTAFGNTIPLPPYDTGRFSNGPVWVETLAAGLGLSVSPSLLGGNDYAYGGATVAPSAGQIFPSLSEQSDIYLNDVGGAADASALYVIWGGGNDVRSGDLTGDIDAMVGMVESLAASGATSFLIPNLPDIGLTPEQLNNGNSAAATATTLQWNADLAAAVDDLVADLGVSIVLLDVFDLFNQLINDPSSFGFANTNEQCFEGASGVGGAGDVCANPDEYVFWDGIHPTAAAHEVLGGIALDALGVSAVPVPAALPLLFGALGALGFVGRRRQRA